MKKSQIDIYMEFFQIGVDMAETRKKLEKDLFDACLESAKKMGGRLGDLSWFGKNHK